MRATKLIPVVVCCLAATALADHGRQQDSTSERLAPVLTGLGDHHHPVTAATDEAQQFFDQGLRLCYAFNHAEAIRAFREAARLDPKCAMAYWGHALALGPNINAPMEREAEKQAYEVLQKAIALKDTVTQKEADYINALSVRYSIADDADRKALDKNYANAMRNLAQRYPGDLDAVTLYAESMMDLRPWDFWTQDGHPQPGTEEIVTALESVIAQNPNHPGALHYYIHAVEASQNPARAEVAADRLLKLMPAAGHMVHMPAHIYLRLGRYVDASSSNVLAIAADNQYITQCNAQGLYPLVYHPHNMHFLWASATFEGRSEEAILAARKVASKVPLDMLSQPGMSELNNFLVPPLFALTRFGKWREVLAEPAFDPKFKYPTGIWHYARGMACAAQGEFDSAEVERKQLEAIALDPELKDLTVAGASTAGQILAIALESLSGEMAARQGDPDRAIPHLERAVRLQDGLPYYEPPPWHYPVRQSLGAVLLQANRPAEAETVYFEDLRRYPENGWSLFGLVQALRAQQKDAQADVAQQRFDQAWSRADVKLTSSRF